MNVGRGGFRVAGCKSQAVKERSAHFDGRTKSLKS
jgi:hypothetical protein